MQHVQPVEIEVEEIADGILVRLFGEMDLNSTTTFRDEMHQLQLAMPARLVLDLSGVSYIDSSVVTILVQLMQAARRSDGILVLCGLQDRVREILEISGLGRSVFTIVETTDEAVAIPHRRRFKRYSPESITCDRGELVDISAGGLRLRTQRRLRGRVRLRLCVGDEELSVRAEVRWKRRLGFRRHEAGLRFIDLDTDDARRLAAIVGRLRNVAEHRR